jgi:hypothetical protein
MQESNRASKTGGLVIVILWMVLVIEVVTLVAGSSGPGGSDSMGSLEVVFSNV